VLHAGQHGLGRGAPVPRSHRRGRPQARRLNPAGFSLGFGGLGKLLLLLLRLALGRRWRSRPTKSGGPPLFEPSLKVQGYKAHNRNSGFAVLPSMTTSTLTASERFPHGIRIGRPCAGTAFQVLVVGRFDCGRIAGLNRGAVGAYSKHVRAATNFRGAEKSRIWLGGRYSMARWRNGSHQGLHCGT
jgi:hypothetical protein